MSELLKTQMSLGRPLRVGAYSSTDPAEAELGRRESLFELGVCRCRSGARHHEAGTPHELGRLDEGRWSVCRVTARELALGHPLPALYPDGQEGGSLAAPIGASTQRVPAAACALSPWADPSHVRPVPTRNGSGWTLFFRSSPESIARFEAWLSEQDETAPPCGVPAA